MNDIRYTDVYDYELDKTHPQAAIVTKLPDLTHGSFIVGEFGDSASAHIRPEVWDIALVIEHSGDRLRHLVSAGKAEDLAAWLLAAARYIREQEAEVSR